MNTSPSGIKFIQDQEGYEPAPYQDMVGYWTVGWGHKMSQEEISKWPAGVNLPRTICLDLLQQDINIAEDGIRELVKVPLNQNQWDALVDFVFNLGVENLKISTFLKDLNNGNYNAAAAQIPLWDHADGRVVQDLKTRRLDERTLFLA